MQYFKLLITLFLFLLNSCGGGGTAPTEPESDKYLYFIDAPVNGVDYRCGNYVGKTKSYQVDGTLKHGVAMCNKGAVTFSIASLTLGTLTSYQNGQAIHLQDLVGISKDQINDKVIKFGMLIQALDDDGDIEKKIDINETLATKVAIESVDDFDLDSFREYIAQLIGKEINATIDEVATHIIKHTGIPLFDENNITIEVQDNIQVGTTIDRLAIQNATQDMNITIIDGKSSDFEFLHNGTIRLNQSLDYRRQYLYDYTIKAHNAQGYSKEAFVTIKVMSSNQSYRQPLTKPLLQTSTIYTNQNQYNLTIQGQQGTNLYIDGIKIALFDETNLTLTRTIEHFNATQKLSLAIGYENGLR